MIVADVARQSRHHRGVLDSKGLIAELERLKSVGATTNADLGRLIGQPSSRIAEIFSGKRGVKIDEMKILVEHFDLEPSKTIPLVPNADTLEPILDALLPLLPPSGRVTDESRRALAESLSYGLGLLDNQPSKQASDDALTVAARAAVSRFLEIRPA